MWKLFKIVGWILKTIFWLLVTLLVVLLIILYILERDVPTPIVRRIETAISTDDIHVRIDRITFSLRSGLRFHRIKALPKHTAEGALMAADEITVDFSLLPHTPLYERIRGVTIKNISVPALPPSHPDRPSTPKNDPVLPDLAPFPLIVENTDILGIKTRHLSAMVDFNDKAIEITDVSIQWPETRAYSMSVEGQVTIDFAKKLVFGHAKGQAFPENLLTLFHVIHTRGAIRQIDCFSKLERPVNADYTFDANIDNKDFTMILALDVGPCSYRDVPMEFAKGTLGIYSTNIYTDVVIEPLEAKSAAGEPLSGRLAYREKEDSLEIKASTAMDTGPLFNIINILNHGELERIRCAVPPNINAQGVIALSSTESRVTNDLSGKISLGEGSILNFHVKDMLGDFTLKNYSARFDNVTGLSMSGGKVSGDIVFSFPDYAATSTVFTSNIAVNDVGIEEFSKAFNVTNTRAGLISGNITISGSTHKNTIASLSGSGSARVRDGVINRMKLFAGFTDYLSHTIPGISSLVNQSSGSMDFTIRDGVLTTENMLIEGDIFSIKGRGTYNLVTDKLDFVVRANIFKQKTIAGKITRLVTMPFTRLLLEFKVFGSLENPDWSYVNIIEKITEGISEMSPITPKQ